jgi:C1A family cysteine protease
MKIHALWIVVLGWYTAGAFADGARIEQLRAQGKAKGWTFAVGDTSLLNEPRQAITGFKRDPHWREMASFVKPVPKDTLPSKWDWRDQGMVTPIKNQHLPQYCGSCWAFGTDAVLESAILRATGKQVILAEQQLVSCQPSYGTCEGGDFAFGFYQQVGANHESDFPYAAADVACKTDAPQYEKIAKWSYVGDQFDSPSTDDLKQAIYQFGPIAVTVAASDSFVAYKGGIYNACDSTDIDHILTLVGWDDADQVWLVKNSWGTDWGEQGFMRIKYTDANGQKCNSIGDSAAYPTYTAKTR